MEVDAGKRVSWVELYLDLVFVLAIAELAQLIVRTPEMRSVWIALGLFVTLWWTWIGFAALYNRRGADTRRQRLLFLAASVPVGVAAVAVEPAATGDIAVFAGSLAAIRLLLALAYAAADEERERRIMRAYLVSAGLFAVSIVVPGPVRYVLWALAIGGESGTIFTRDRAVELGRHRHARPRDLAALRPADPDDALDPSHFAERFGLFLIILLGEVLVQAGQASVNGHGAGVGGWAALAAAMLLAAALWWLYFDAAVELNLAVLRLTAGSPSIARAVFAGGHMLPAFGLLITASGVGLLLGGHPPRIADWLACVGISLYLAGTRAFLRGTSRGPLAARIVLVVATTQLARLRPELSPHAYLWLLAAWVWGCAVLGTTSGQTEALGRPAAGS
jgi:low temperature requirement protein LtrA